MNTIQAVAVYLLSLIVLASFLFLGFLSLAEFVATIAPGLAENAFWPDPDRQEALTEAAWPVFFVSCMALGGILWWRGRRETAANDDD